MPKTFILIVALVLSAGPSTAGVDCSVVSQIREIQTSLVKIRSQSPNWISEDNIRYLRGLSETLSPVKVSRAFVDYDNRPARESLMAFAAAIVSLRSFLKSTSGPQLAVLLQGDEWRVQLDTVGDQIKALPCGQWAAHDPAKASTGGGEPDEGLAETSQSQPNRTEQVLTVGFIGGGIIAGLAGFMRWLLPILRARKSLKRRRAKRFNVALSTYIQLKAREIDAQIVNISCTGAKFRFWDDAPIPLKQKASIFVDDEWKEGTVVWSNNVYAGIQFQVSLPISFVRKLAKGDTRKTLLAASSANQN